MLNVTILSNVKVVFKGQAESVIVPGDMGVFEIMSYHKRVLSRLLGGMIDVDGRNFPIVRGVVKVDTNDVMIVVEEE